jgi:hypothetical protein
MLDLITREPWLIPSTIGLLIPIGLVACKILRSVQRSRQSELELSLKLDMLQRGMSADEIVRVLQARSGHDSSLGKCTTFGQERPVGAEQT